VSTVSSLVPQGGFVVLTAVGVVNGLGAGLLVGCVVVADAAVLEFGHGHGPRRVGLWFRFVGRSVASPCGGLLPVSQGPKAAHPTFCPSAAFLAKR